MKLLGQAMLAFGLIATGMLAVFYFFPDSFMHTPKYLAAIFVSGIVAFIGGCITVWYATRKDVYPEFLADAHKHGAVLEDNGVKMTILVDVIDVMRSDLLDAKILIENATDSPRDVTIHLKQLVRLALKQKDNLYFPEPTSLKLEDGEVVIVHVPVLVSKKASAGRYILDAEINAKGDAKGRRMRHRQGYTGSPGYRNMMKILSMFQFQPASVSFVFYVKDDRPRISTPDMNASTLLPEVGIERLWSPGDMQKGGPLPALEVKSFVSQKRAIAIIAILLIIGAIIGIGAAINLGFALRCQTVQGRVEKVEIKNKDRRGYQASSGPNYRTYYAYVINGVTYQGREDLYSSPEKSIRVFYDPDEPSRSQIEKPLPAYEFAWAAVFLAGAILGWWKWIRKADNPVD